MPVYIDFAMLYPYLEAEKGGRPLFFVSFTLRPAYTNVAPSPYRTGASGLVPEFQRVLPNP